MLDEAHKYLGADHGELGATLLECIRQMRHHGLRVVISTQDPTSISRSMLELATFVMLHFFSAPSWFSHLESALPLTRDKFDTIRRFANHPGRVLVHCARSSVRVADETAEFFAMHVRPRLTVDAGASRIHEVP